MTELFSGSRRCKDDDDTDILEAFLTVKAAESRIECLS